MFRSLRKPKVKTPHATSRAAVPYLVESHLSGLISDLVYERAQGEEENERLRVTLAHLKQKQAALREHRILDEGAYARTRTQLYLSLIVIATSLALSTTIFYLALGGFAALIAAPPIRWGISAILAMTLTGSSILLTQNLLRRMYSRSYQTPE
ncbi:MAG: hypothetical protein R3268_14925, partial [Acidiferrobacterales bacterium]|nr:hypothetical protein [Acidiferrobacterales bacterium]